MDLSDSMFDPNEEDTNDDDEDGRKVTWYKKVMKGNMF